LLFLDFYLILFCFVGFEQNKNNYEKMLENAKNAGNKELSQIDPTQLQKPVLV